MRTLIGLAVVAFTASQAQAQRLGPFAEVARPVQLSSDKGRNECLTRKSDSRTFCRTREEWRRIALKIERRQARTR
jgi:RimJ/RimL family protein N-acetyltransferase